MDDVVRFAAPGPPSTGGDGESGDRRGTDPLSSATRATKRNLLLFSALIILVKSNSVILAHMSGITIGLTNPVLSTLLFLALVYFCFEFLTAWLPDLWGRKGRRRDLVTAASLAKVIRETAENTNGEMDSYLHRNSWEGRRGGQFYAGFEEFRNDRPCLDVIRRRVRAGLSLQPRGFSGPVYNGNPPAQDIQEEIAAILSRQIRKVERAVTLHRGKAHSVMGLEFLAFPMRIWVIDGLLPLLVAGYAGLMLWEWASFSFDFVPPLVSEPLPPPVE